MPNAFESRHDRTNDDFQETKAGDLSSQAEPSRAGRGFALLIRIALTRDFITRYFRPVKASALKERHKVTSLLPLLFATPPPFIIFMYIVNNAKLYIYKCVCVYIY